MRTPPNTNPRRSRKPGNEAARQLVGVGARENPRVAVLTARFRVLGPLEVVGDGDPRAVHGGRQRILLAALLAARGATVPADSLAELLWGEALPDNPTAALHSQVSRLRRSLARVLGGGCDLVTRAPGYALTVSPEDVDALRFERLIAAARAANTEDAADMYDEALQLWRGSAYGEFADVLPAFLEGIRLDELRLAAVEERARALLELGRAASVIPGTGGVRCGQSAARGGRGRVDACAVRDGPAHKGPAALSGLPGQYRRDP